MRYHALVTDYDSTIAEGGRVNQETIDALERVRASGRRLVLVTGRQLDGLIGIFEPMEIFDRVVAENGAVLYSPATKQQRLLCETLPMEFIRAVRHSEIFPLCEGRVIVATERPNETEILGFIRDLGLELQVIFNKSAVMVLPSGVNKASGLQVALQEIGLSVHNAVGIGDAENDHAFLAATECSVAVDNAVEGLKKRVDFVTRGRHGYGVIELIVELLDSDLDSVKPALTRHRMVIGKRAEGSEVFIDPYGSSVVIAGTSGAGKSTLASAFIERLSELGYQFCVIDPEGDHLELPKAVVLGDAQRPGTVPEAMAMLEQPLQNVVINLLGVPLEERPVFFETLLHRIQELRDRKGRPHWLIVDEAHHVLPSESNLPGVVHAEGGMGVALISVEAAKLPAAWLRRSDLVLVAGEEPERVLREFSAAVGRTYRKPFGENFDNGNVLGWFWKTSAGPFSFSPTPVRSERQRHKRKYAQGELAEERSFYFRGPQNKLNLRAHNLATFLQIADGIDDETWLFHLSRGDVSRWFRDEIKDSELALLAQRFEVHAVPAASSKEQIRAEVQRKYIGAV